MKYKLLFMSICILYSTNLLAGGFKIAMQGQKQIGMGSLGVGFAQDAATIYFNPAGMSFVKPQFNGGVNLLFPSVSFLETNTQLLTNSVSQVFTPLSAYGSTHLGKKKKVSIGLGIYTPFGSGVTYPFGWSGQYILKEIELQNVFIQPTLSYRINDKLSVGAGFVYSTGTVLLARQLPLQSGQDKFVGRAQLEGDAHGMGFNVGAYYKATEKLHLGLTYHSKVNMKVEDGDARFTNIPAALQTNFPATNTFNAELPLPSELAAGLSYRINSKWVLGLDVNYTFWNTFDTLGFDYATNTANLQDTRSPRMYENAACVRVGAQYMAHQNLDLRAGIFLDQTPVQDEFVSPELPDNNKLGLSIGATIRLYERLHMDLSLLYESVKAREVHNLETGLKGTYQTEILAPGVGITYLFMKRTYIRKNY